MSRYDSRNSQEELLGQFVAEFTGVPITTKDRMIDSKNIKTRLMAVVLLLISGAVVGLAGTWVYFHLLHH